MRQGGLASGLWGGDEELARALEASLGLVDYGIGAGAGAAKVVPLAGSSAATEDEQLALVLSASMASDSAGAFGYNP